MKQASANVGSEATWNPWPWNLLVFFGLLAVAVGAAVTLAISQSSELVSKDYYDQEIRYQERMDAIRRTQSNMGETIVTQTSDSVEIRILGVNAGGTNPPIAGRVHFFRPSDSRLDWNVPLALSADGVQVIPVTKISSGFWRVRVDWNQAGEAYWHEKALTL